MEEGTTFRSLTQKNNNMRGRWANNPTFVLTKASQPTIVFDNINVNSNNKTIDKENEGVNNNTNDNNNNETNQEVFMELPCKKSKKYLDNAITFRMLCLVGMYFVSIGQVCDEIHIHIP